MLAKMAKHLLWLAVGPLLVGCAAPNSEPPTYYQLPLSSEASVQPAIIEGTLEQVRRRGGLPRVLYEPDRIDRVCAYVFSVDGQIVGDRADCTAAVPIAPGTHMIAAWLERDRYSRSTTTLMFDAAEGHHYKISMDRIDFTRGRARIWITDVTTQTSVTEAKLVTPQVGVLGALGNPVVEAIHQTSPTSMLNNGDSLLSRISSVIEEAMPRLSAKIAKNLLWLAVGPLLVGCAKPNSELPTYYQPPSSGEASVRPAIVEGTLEQVSRAGGLPTVLYEPEELYEPEAVDRFCAYVFSVDGRLVGDRADCTAAVPIAPGKHTIAARLQGDRYSRRGKRTFNPSRATLMFDAEEGHRYKISMDTPSSNAAYPRRVWITDLTTQTSVTEAALVTRNSPEGVPRWEPDLGGWYGIF